MFPHRGTPVQLKWGESQKAELRRERIGYVNLKDLRTLLSKKFNGDGRQDCETYISAKIIKVLNPILLRLKQQNFFIVFLDMVGPIKPVSIHGYRYFVTFIDDYSSLTVVKFLTHKNRASKSFKEFIAENGTP